MRTSIPFRRSPGMLRAAARRAGSVARDLSRTPCRNARSPNPVGRATEHPHDSFAGRESAATDGLGGGTRDQDIQVLLPSAGSPRMGELRIKKVKGVGERLVIGVLPPRVKGVGILVVQIVAFAKARVQVQEH